MRRFKPPNLNKFSSEQLAIFMMGLALLLAIHFLGST